ncbi:hypothetical protein MMC20_004653 [Loxospora ochrophaea]|nr:hypothetical protein [Loxospora ochrophaea]
MATNEEAMKSLVTSADVAVIVIFIALATAAVILRIWAQSINKKAGGLDDIAIILALVFCYGLLITSIVAVVGGGLNTIRTDIDPMSAAILYVKVLFVEPFLEYPALGFFKISVLLFYRRIFIFRWFIRLCDFLVCFCTLWVLAIIIAQANVAHPVSKIWDLTGDYFEYNYDRFALATAGMSICLDLITLCLPLPVIHRLHMGQKQKVMTISILWLGVFCVVADSVRFYYGYKEVAVAVSSSGNDRYYLSRKVWLWDRITPCSSIVAACLPTYGPLIRGTNFSSIFSTAASWFSISSTKQSATTKKATCDSSPSSGTVNSRQAVRSWQRLHDDKASGDTSVTSNNMELESQIRTPSRDDQVQVTSTFDLEVLEPQVR